MGVEMRKQLPKSVAMRTYEEELTERIFLTSDKRLVVGETDDRGRTLYHGKSKVSRHSAKLIRELGGSKFLKPISDTDKPKVAVADAADMENAVRGHRVDPPKMHPNVRKDAAPKAPPAPEGGEGTGPDRIVDFGRTHKGKRFGDLPKKYLEGLTKGRNPDDRKAWAKSELARREDPAAPPAPAETLTYGPDDTPNIGIHQGVAVRDLPEEYLTSLAGGADETHHGWTKTELARRAEEV